MQTGSIISGIFHGALAAVVVFGLPSWNKPPPEPDEMSTVEVVMLAPRATAPELTRPPMPKPPEPPKPEAKPTPAPPVPAAAPPPPPPKVEAKPEPTPAPPPPPKVEAKPEPEPLPEPKPEPVPEKIAEALPEKKEEPKKEEPKPVEPKRAEPKKEEPTKVEAKPQKDRFDSVLDSVLKNRAPSRPSRPDPAARPTQQASLPQPIQSAPTLSSQLARSEIDAVRERVRPCWNFPVGAPNPERLIVDIRVEMNPDGTVRDAAIVDRSRMNDPFYRSAAEAALRAALNRACQPFPLPPGKFNIWRTFTFGFDPRDM